MTPDLARLREALDAAEPALERYADADHDDATGRAIGNAAMNALIEVRAALAAVDKLKEAPRG